jgi:hypothetical protein
MASINNHILTITEPTIKLDEVVFESFGEGEPEATKAETSKGYLIMISINGYVFSDKDVLKMVLDCNGSLPTIDLTLSDSQGLFNVDTFPRDGDVINFRMGTLDKKSYKDIRIDFDITSADQPKQNSNVKGGKYNFSGRIKVPGLYADECKSYGVGTSLDHIESIANDLKLGVATNIDSADDKMNLILPYNSRFDTLEDLVKHSYIDEDSFQTYCIDQYYYVNYVNLNTLLESEETIEEVIAAFDKELNDVPGNGSEDAANQGKKPLILTNHKRDSGTNLFIEAQSLANSAGSKTKKNGYKRTLQFFENDSDEGLVSHDIEPLASKNMSELEEPMKGRRDEDRYKGETKTKYTGRKNADPETSHTHLNYEYSAISNAQNMDEIKKMSLEVSLASFNPAIHLFQKIPVVIYTGAQEKLGADKVIKDAKKEKGFDTTVKDDPSDVGTGQFVLDEFLSAYYVVGGIEYTFKAGDASVKQKLKLLRREWPSRINNINPETVAAAPTPATPAPAPPVPPPTPEPVIPPPPPEPPKEPVLDLDLSYFKYANRLGSWYEFKPLFSWTADDKTLVTETPKIKVKFVGPLEKEYDANVTLENQGESWDSYNSTLEIPKATFKDKEGDYTIKVSLTYKEQKVEKEVKFTWNPWKAGDIIDQGAVTETNSKKVFVWDVKYGPDYGKFVGAYTLNGDAIKKNYSPPKNGKEEGEKLDDVLKKTEEANRTELMKG